MRFCSVYEHLLLFSLCLVQGDMSLSVDCFGSSGRFLLSYHLTSPSSGLAPL